MRQNWTVIVSARLQEAVILARRRWAGAGALSMDGHGTYHTTVVPDINYCPAATLSWHEGSLFHAEQVTDMSDNLGPIAIHSEPTINA